MTQLFAAHHTRRMAVEILTRVDQKRHTLDHWLEWADAQQKNLPAQDRAFIRSLVYGTLRWQRRLDWMIDQFTTRSAKSIEPVVLTVLRLGVFQLCYMDRVPVPAAVHTSVELIKQLKRPWAAGFVNKVLRRTAGESERISWPDPTADPVAALAVIHAFPKWIMSRWIQRWGVEATQRLCLTINTIPFTTLRTNTLKTTRNELITTLQDTYPSIRPTPYSPDGMTISGSIGPLNQHPAFGQGLFQIQDEAAQLVAHMLDPQPGQLVWDACAGQGTKTGHLAQIMKNKGQILACDVHSKKLTRLAVEMQRLDIDIVQTSTLDLSKPEALLNLPLFDRILLDAPCSGMGVLRKNPDGKWSVTMNDLIRHQQQQVYFLHQAVDHLKPGGILVYSVCSMEPEETRLVIEEFLRKHAEFDIHRVPMNYVTKGKTLMTPTHCLSTRPDVHDMDGFFAVALKKAPLP